MADVDLHIPGHSGQNVCSHSGKCLEQMLGRLAVHSRKHGESTTMATAHDDFLNSIGAGGAIENSLHCGSQTFRAVQSVSLVMRELDCHEAFK